MNINEEVLARQQLGTPSTFGVGGKALDTARVMLAGGEAEGLQSKAHRMAYQSATDAARHERLAEKLTPEIETALWCWQECLALGLIDIRVIADAAAREKRLR